MQCPKCTTTIPPSHIDISDSRAIIGYEVGFLCPGCRREFYCIVTPGTFLERTPVEIPDEGETAGILSLAGVEVDEAVVSTWSARQRQSACTWAVATCYKADGHFTEVPPMPGFLEEHQVPFMKET
jgi:hypothetical protein